MTKKLYKIQSIDYSQITHKEYAENIYKYIIYLVKSNKPKSINENLKIYILKSHKYFYYFLRMSFLISYSKKCEKNIKI